MGLFKKWSKTAEQSVEAQRQSIGVGVSAGSQERRRASVSLFNVEMEVWVLVVRKEKLVYRFTY